jgi:hypothetical protein
MALLYLLLVAICGHLEIVILDALKSDGASAQELAVAILENGNNNPGVISPETKKLSEGVRLGGPLGISNGFISSAQITSSTDYNAHHDTKGVRLLRAMNPVSSWSALHNNDQQWVQVDLLKETNVTGVATQGRGRYPQWVTTYRILYSNDGNTWTTYEEDGEIKVFDGNADENSVVKNDFANPFSARFVRLNPATWFGHVSLRMELYGDQDVCNSGLGMVSGALDSSRLAASSSLNEAHDERGSRLLTYSVGAHSLSVQHLNEHQYLQIDVGLVTTITAVATQGRNNAAQWVKTYLLRYSVSGSTWSTYRDNGAVKIFGGNTDTRAVVTHRLNNPITARYVRFHPQMWYGYISFRAEVYGCPCECDFPLGMTTGEIDAFHVTTSSDYNPVHDQRGARLLTDTVVGSWTAKYSDVYQWIQVDLKQLHKVTGVSTQGRLHYNQWVTSYYVSYSNDGQGWTLYHEPGKQDPELFLGNADRDEVTKHTFFPPIKAKFARILPQTWHGHISLRFEFYGCAA